MTTMKVSATSKATGLREHKVETTMEDLLYYLEEMYQMGLANEREERIYESYQYGEYVTKKDWVYIAKRSYKHNFEAF